LLGSEDIVYGVDLEPRSCYSIHINSVRGALDIDVSNGGSITIENGDRKTPDRGPREWFEMRHLFDLIELPENTHYEFPSLPKTFAKTPNTTPCSGLWIGTFR
jgi:hypothetical protein